MSAVLGRSRAALPVLRRTRTLPASARRGLYLGGALLAAIVLGCVLVPLLSGGGANQLDLAAVRTPPSSAHLLGTDGIGRDLLHRIALGGRNSLLIAASGVVCSMLIGSLVGLLAAFGGRTAQWSMMRLIDIQLAFPYVLLAIAVASAVRPSVPTLVLLMALAGWPQVARVVRGVGLQERAKDYVKAAEVIGASRRRVALKYVFPTILPALLALAPLQAAGMIIFEATLSFLGLGIQPPTPSWGSIMFEGQDYLTSAWWLTTFPGLAILLTSLALLMLANVAQRAIAGESDVLDTASLASMSPAETPLAAPESEEVTS